MQLGNGTNDLTSFSSGLGLGRMQKMQKMRTVGAGPEGPSFSLSQVAKVSPPLKIYSCYMFARCVGTGNTINSECLFSTFSAGTAPSCTPEGHMLRSKSCELSEAYYCSGHLLATSSQIELLVLFFVFLSVGPHHDMEMHITTVEQHYCKNKEHILYYYYTISRMV